jgi:hypothetical protein
MELLWLPWADLLAAGWSNWSCQDEAPRTLSSVGTAF